MLRIQFSFRAWMSPLFPIPPDPLPAMDGPPGPVCFENPRALRWQPEAMVDINRHVSCRWEGRTGDREVRCTPRRMFRDGKGQPPSKPPSPGKPRQISLRFMPLRESLRRPARPRLRPGKRNQPANQPPRRPQRRRSKKGLKFGNLGWDWPARLPAIACSGACAMWFGPGVRRHSSWRWRSAPWWLRGPAVALQAARSPCMLSP